MKRNATWVLSGVFILTFSVLLVFAIRYSWLLTMMPETVDDWYITEITTTLYYAFGTAGIVTAVMLIKGVPVSDEKIQWSALIGAILMGISFVVAGLLQSCKNPWVKFIAYILQIPMNIGMSWFFARLGHMLDWLVNHFDYKYLKKLLRVK